LAAESVDEEEPDFFVSLLLDVFDESDDDESEDEDDDSEDELAGLRESVT
jgi:hypothetical protein